MPKNAVVTLRFGPYSAVGLSVEHRTYRLEGLQAVLAKDGHQVILEKIEDWNLVELMVNEETIFHCNIQDLEFESIWKGTYPDSSHSRKLSRCLKTNPDFKTLKFSLGSQKGKQKETQEMEAFESPKQEIIGHLKFSLF